MHLLGLVQKCIAKPVWRAAQSKRLECRVADCRVGVRHPQDLNLQRLYVNTDDLARLGSTSSMGGKYLRFWIRFCGFGLMLCLWLSSQRFC